MITDKQAREAYIFLGDENPLGWDPMTWQGYLLDFMWTLGNEAIVDLAGAVVYFQNKEDKNWGERYIIECLNHDIRGWKNKDCFVPRSKGYGEYWLNRQTAEEEVTS